MTVEELKFNLENKADLPPLVLVYKSSNSYFLALQYLNEYSKYKNLDIQLVDEFQINFFGYSDSLQVKIVDSYSSTAALPSDCFVICKETANKESIQLPEIENWQIKDYVYSKLDGVNHTLIDNFIISTGSDLFRINSEINKISIFEPSLRQDILIDILQQNGKSDLDVFGLVNKLIKRDFNLNDDSYFEINPFSLLTLLVNNLRSIIIMTSNKYATPEECGLSEKQFFAIKKNNTGFYSLSELISIYKILVDLDFKVKSGILESDFVVRYIILKFINLGR